MFEQCPVLGICGRSGPDKTAWIETLIPRLRDLGLQVAAVMSGGQDVLCAAADAVLVEGPAATDLPQIWLAGPDDEGPPSGQQGRILAVLRPEDRAAPERVFELLQAMIAENWRQAPVWGCVLIGGRSSRMGQPKHLLLQAGRTWLERAVEKLSPKVGQVVLAGSGQIPAPLAALPQVPDAPGIAGPLAGILAVMRWQPAVSWLVVACDLPDVQPESFDWLLDQRRPGMRAILPQLTAGGPLEPLLAWYDLRCRPLLERLAVSDSFRLSRLAGHPGVCALQPPACLRSSWRNVNTPEELRQTEPPTPQGAVLSCFVKRNKVA